tara:strand:+ start:6497 stop:7858 length:1362 start_codon:yes stop_codon:yes gene_type:complete
MAQNISITEGVSSHSTKVIETCNRPLLIKYAKGAGAVVPVLVQIDVEVKEKIDGAFVFVKKGDSLVQGRDSDSTEAAPTFTFDISSILKSGIKKDIDFSLYGTSNGATGISRKNDFPLLAEYRVKAKNWFININGVLEYNSDDTAIATSSATLFFCDIEIPDDEVNLNKFSNTLSRTFKASGWRLGSNLSDKSFGKFLSNCPSNLRRTIPTSAALSLSVFCENLGGDFQVVADYVNNSGTSIVAGNLLTGDFIASSDKLIKTVNLSVADAYLTANLASTNIINMRGGNVDVYLKESSNETKKLKFELINGSLLINSSFRDVEHYVIYFVNDYNCLDFYTFESNLGVSHTHSKSIYKTGFKDYTKRDSSKFGVSRGRTDVVYTLSTVVNQEASEWLSEMYRSTNAFLMEIGADQTPNYVPIIITDADTTPLPQDRRNVEKFTISFVKDVHTVKQ